MRIAATVELSLSSLMFRDLSPDACDPLGVVAFFPQGVDENKLDWLFPTITGRMNIFDKFCILSLTYRSDSFITTLAPLRNYLCPKDPKLAPLLCSAKNHHFSRLSSLSTLTGLVSAKRDGSRQRMWTSSICLMSSQQSIQHRMMSGALAATFLDHLYWHKSRLVILGPKIEGLPDDHHSKPRCLCHTSQLFQAVGDYVEFKRLLNHTLRIQRERGGDNRAVETLRRLSDANRLINHLEEGSGRQKKR